MNEKPARNGCLTLILYAGLIVSVFRVIGSTGILAMKDTWFMQGMGNEILRPYAWVGLITSALLIYGFLGIFFWRRWGAYVIVGSYVLGAVVNVVSGGLAGSVLWALIVMAVLLLLLYKYLLPEWGQMD